MALGFLKKLFGEKESSPLQATVEMLPRLIEKEFLLKKNELEDSGAKKLAEIKHLHARGLALIRAISEKELEEKENLRFNKAALTSKTQLEKQMLQLFDKINPKERGKTLDDLRAYSGETSAVLIKDVASLRKNIFYTSVYLKEEMKELGECLQEMQNTLQGMNGEFAKSGELFGFEETKEKVGLIVKRKEQIAALEEEIGSLEKGAAEKAAEAEKQKQKLLAYKVGEEALEVKTLEEEQVKLMESKQDLKSEISSLISSIDRPLQRFKALVDSGRWVISAEQKEILNGFLTNPMLALKKDPKAETFKQVLAEVMKAIEDEKLELKDKEKEKRLSALQELIAFDFFGKVFWKMNEIQKRQVELTKALEKNSAQKQILKDEEKIKELERAAEELKEKASFTEQERSRVLQQMQKEILFVKEFAEHALGRSIVIKED